MLKIQQRGGDIYSEVLVKWHYMKRARFIIINEQVYLHSKETITTKMIGNNGRKDN